MIDSNDALIGEFAKRNCTDKVAFYVCFMIFDAYYTMNKPEWINQKNKQYIEIKQKRDFQNTLKNINPFGKQFQ